MTDLYSDAIVSANRHTALKVRSTMSDFQRRPGDKASQGRQSIDDLVSAAIANDLNQLIDAPSVDEHDGPGEGHESV